MITGTERLLATIEGRQMDRVPIFTILLDQGARELGLSVEKYYSSGESVAEGQLRLRAKYGYDNVWSLFYVGKEAELLGSQKIIFSEEGPPNVEDFIIKTPDDIRNLRVPDDLREHPAFQEPLKCLKILKQEVGGKHPICAYLTASATIPALLMGMDNWMELALLGPNDLRDELLAKCSDFFQKEIAAYREAGADVLVYSNPFGSTDIIPRRFFHEVSMPWMERDLKPGGVDGVVYYCGGARFNNVILDVREHLGIGAYYLSPMDDIAEGKRIIDGTGLTCGVINDIMLLSWTPAEVRSEVRRIMEAGAPGGRFLFGTLLMPYRIPEANIHAMIEAAIEFGSYDTSRG